MSGKPSVEYVIEPEDGRVYAYNPLFPNMRIDASASLVDDLVLMVNNGDEPDVGSIKKILLSSYVHKYGY